MILMSPPCQPFTRTGLQGDTSDPRTKSFLYILDLLPRLAALPRYILLENVKGFETSAARESLVNTLKTCGYTFQEVLVSPTSLGIPNSRLRYFLLAAAPPARFRFETSAEIIEGFPRLPSSDSDSSSSSHPALAPPTSCPPNTCPKEEEQQEEEEEEEAVSPDTILYKLETSRDADRKSCQNADLSVRQIREFLELRSDRRRLGGEEGEGEGEDEEEEEEVSHYLLPPKTLLRYALLMDIVTPSCRRSVCFTKGYGHYVEGYRDLCCSSCSAGRESVSTRQRYRVLGNSLNVQVVAALIRLMVS
ncbi:hypothetical protein CRUP_025757 [Coryphaenoides rupestris]|nr:hypothetical protein CRUP_025757 [Coryphaenoides rupestris]